MARDRVSAETADATFNAMDLHAAADGRIRISGRTVATWIGRSHEAAYIAIRHLLADGRLIQLEGPSWKGLTQAALYQVNYPTEPAPTQEHPSPTA